jgi:RimJ/RimL family protein N-acetyltransferase
MAFVNSYKPSGPPTAVTSNGPYNINFAFSLPQATLESPRVKLTPFIPSLHAEPFFAIASAHPDLSRYLPFTFPDLSKFLFFIEAYFRSDPTSILFAVIEKTRPNPEQDLVQSLAGIVGLYRCSPQNLSTEIGPVIILPAFQRTFVSSNAIGIVLRYCLDLPTGSNPGLGFRRVQWTANPNNAASIRAAERMGMRLEGTMRWTWVMGEGKEGKEVVGRGEGPGRDSVILAVCWDDWEGGVREHVGRLIERV